MGATARLAARIDGACVLIVAGIERAQARSPRALSGGDAAALAVRAVASCSDGALGLLEVEARLFAGAGCALGYGERFGGERDPQRSDGERALEEASGDRGHRD